jgi:two-component system chemotaxis response regulator CheY
VKILIVDGSRVMRQIVVRTLRQAGFTGHDLVEAANGREGLAAVRAEAPELVLSDWDMPGMTGLDLLTALRAAGDEVPFVFVTAERSQEVITRAEQAGAMSVIAKPFTPETFREKLEPVLG